MEFNFLQLFNQIKIDAGQTTGSILISTIDDESYEADETIIVGFGTPINAILRIVLELKY